MTEDLKKVAAKSAELERAIQEVKEVAAEIRDAADHLSVVNTVLQHQLPDDVQVGEVAQALEQSEAVEKNIASSADSLDAVNTALEKAAVAKRAVAAE